MGEPVRVAVDAMGGDRAPEEIVAGAIAARSNDLEPMLFGIEELLKPLAEDLPIVDTPTVVAMDEKPADAAREKRDSSVFAREILDVAEPAVALLSIGEEREKGNRLTIEAHRLLAASDLHFVGNVESRELLRGTVDVVVCDGFTGNVVLKAMEGTVRTT